MTEEHRDTQTFAAVETFFKDIRYALRALGKSPSFTVVAVMTLALGIGVNATVFTVTNAVLFKGFPQVVRNDRVLYLGTREDCCVSYPDFQDWRTQAKSFADMGVVADLRITLSDKSAFTESYTATQVTANAFRLLGKRPAIGRDFGPADEKLGAAPVAILTYRLWARRYAGNPAIIGQTVRINDAPTTVIGVMPQGFVFPQNQDLWLPLIPIPKLQKREARGLWFAFGRLADGATVENARAEMATIGRRLEDAYPVTNEGIRPVVQNFHEFFIGPNATAIYGALWGGVGFVLLIACANLANLMLARAIGRSREISVRIALGAGRWRIARQVLIESVMLSSLGGLFGWWIAKWGVRTYEMTANPPGRAWSDHLFNYSMDYRVFAYLIAISIGAGLLFGLAPALRLSKFNIYTALKDGGRGSTGGRRAKRLSALLVIGQMAFAVVLLAGAGVMIHSFLNIYTADLGFKTANIITAYIELLPEATYPNTRTEISFFERLKSRLEANPAVESITIADCLPGQGADRVPYELAGAPPVEEKRRPNVLALVVGPGYFRTLGASLLSGRDFNEADGVSGVPAVIVNRQFASKYWPGEEPLGKRLRVFDGTAPKAWLTVVGVVPDIIVDYARQQIDPLVYVAYRQDPDRYMWVMVRTRGPSGNLAAAFRREVRTLDPALPIWLGPFTLAERLAAAYWSSGLNGALFLIFASIALLLASIGLYAVIANSVSQRTQEIGVRLAIGGTSADILKMVFAQGMWQAGIGLVIGLAASFAVTPILKSQLFQVSPADPITLAAASAILILAAMLGCLIPARRAMRVDPLVALRHE